MKENDRLMVGTKIWKVLPIDKETCRMRVGQSEKDRLSAEVQEGWWLGLGENLDG
jgi:hypothetical protein